MAAETLREEEGVPGGLPPAAAAAGVPEPEGGKKEVRAGPVAEMFGDRRPGLIVVPVGGTEPLLEDGGPRYI